MEGRSHGKMYSEDEMVMISALQHYLFCPRQCALIHLEHLWSENFLTVSGALMHDRVDSGFRESRGQLYRESSVRLVSYELGITGIADVVEFRRAEGPENSSGRAVAAVLRNIPGYWIPCPVEYKRGCPKEHDADRIQLCAQAVCLEEMLSVHIEQGVLFYGAERTRQEVVFSDDLRSKTRETALRVHRLMAAGKTPEAVRTSACRSCSLADLCLPGTNRSRRSVSEWLMKNISEISE